MAGSGRKNADGLLASLLASGRTIPDAAREAGVSGRTVWRRMQNPDFRAQVAGLRAAALERAAALLGDLSVSAAATLGRLLKADSEQAQLGAARAILELGGKLRETVDLEQRLAEAERLLAEREARKWPA